MAASFLGYSDPVSTLYFVLSVSSFCLCSLSMNFLNLNILTKRNLAGYFWEFMRLSLSLPFYLLKTPCTKCWSFRFYPHIGSWKLPNECLLVIEDFSSLWYSVSSLFPLAQILIPFISSGFWWFLTFCLCFGAHGIALSPDFIEDIFQEFLCCLFFILVLCGLFSFLLEKY